MDGGPSKIQVVTNWALLLLAVCLLAITVGMDKKLEVVGFDTQALIDEDKVYRADWQHCPEGSQPITMRVSDENWAAFQTRLNNMLGAYPSNCP